MHYPSQRERRILCGYDPGGKSAAGELLARADALDHSISEKTEGLYGNLQVL